MSEQEEERWITQAAAARIAGCKPDTIKKLGGRGVMRTTEDPTRPGHTLYSFTDAKEQRTYYRANRMTYHTRGNMERRRRGQ